MISKENAWRHEKYNMIKHNAEKDLQMKYHNIYLYVEYSMKLNKLSILWNLYFVYKMKVDEFWNVAHLSATCANNGYFCYIILTDGDECPKR